MVGIYPTLNYVNHSCAHNATLYTPPDQPAALYVVAQRGIRRGEEVTISYMSPVLLNGVVEQQACSYYTRAERQNMLRFLYGFDCACAACRSGV